MKYTIKKTADWLIMRAQSLCLTSAHFVFAINPKVPRVTSWMTQLSFRTKTFAWMCLLVANILVWHKHIPSLSRLSAHSEEFNETCITFYTHNKVDLIQALMHQGLTQTQINLVMSKPEFNKIKLGNRIDLLRCTPAAGSEILKVILHLDNKHQIDLLQTNEGVIASNKSATKPQIKNTTKQTNTMFVSYNSQIGGSISTTLKKLGLSKASAAELLNTYASRIDLKKIAYNDSISIILEKSVKNDRSNNQGKVIYACLHTQNKQYKLYLFKERGEFFFEDGKCATSFLLSNPLKVGRLSSGFGYRKMHANSRSKMHTGVDYSAPAGTPIHAAADGVVTYCGWQGAYGNAVEIKHQNGIATFYAHAKSISKNLRVGSEVKRGVVIGQVGMTGRATGNHLHFEVKVRGRYVDPIKAKRMYAQSLQGKDLMHFKQTKERINALEATLINNKYAKL